jgi:AGCS family alanine or glycine:cation symporter
MRWGLARAVQANEAGVGTSTIPHAQTTSDSPSDQGVLAMAAVYSNMVLCLLTGLTVLVTDAWRAPGARFDITLLADIFSSHFPALGDWPLGVSAFLFGFGTILGNCYNGGQCFVYLASIRRMRLYQIAGAAAVFAGALFDLRFVWTFVDFLLLPAALPHLAAVLRLVRRGEVDFAVAARAVASGGDRRIPAGQGALDHRQAVLPPVHLAADAE